MVAVGRQDKEGDERFLIRSRSLAPYFYGLNGCLAGEMGNFMVKFAGWGLWDGICGMKFSTLELTPVVI